jgi:hypothetical protein
MDTLSEARKYFEQGNDSEVAALTLKKLTEDETDPVCKAYHGAAYALLAKHYSNPLNKLEALNKGLGIINAAVLENTTEVEIRFIRFSVEEHIPAFVPFTSHVKIDKKHILDNLSSSHTWYAKIKAYMLKSSSLTKAEKEKLK